MGPVVLALLLPAMLGFESAAALEEISALPSKEQVEQLERYAATHAYVGPIEVSGPLGRVLLMRRGKDFCAIRFTAFHRGEVRPAGWFSHGGQSLYADYDWRHLEVPDEKAAPREIESGHGKLSDKAGYGIGRFAFDAGEWRLACGPFRPYWRYPNLVRIYEGGRMQDNGLELAPTKARDISEIDFADSRLKWYRYDETRKQFLIPVEDLPGKAS